MLARMFLSLHPQVRITAKLKSNTERQRGKGLIVPTLLQADKLPLIFCSQVSRVNVGDVRASECMKSFHSLDIPNSLFPTSHGESLMLPPENDHLQHNFFKVWVFFYTSFSPFLLASYELPTRVGREISGKDVLSPTCIPQPEAQSSFVFTLSFKTICSSGLIPAHFCLQTQTEGITQIRAVPNQGFPSNLNYFVLVKTKISSWLFIYSFWGFVGKKNKLTQEEGMVQRIFCSFREPPSSKKFECLAGTWLLISPEPPNPLRFFSVSANYKKLVYSDGEMSKGAKKATSSMQMWGGIGRRESTNLPADVIGLVVLLDTCQIK